MKTSISNTFLFLVLAVLALTSKTAAATNTVPGFLRSTRALSSTTPTNKEIYNAIISEMEEKFGAGNCTTFHNQSDKEVTVVCSAIGSDGEQEQLKLVTTYHGNDETDPTSAILTGCVTLEGEDQQTCFRKDDLEQIYNMLEASVDQNNRLLCSCRCADENHCGCMWSCWIGCVCG